MIATANFKIDLSVLLHEPEEFYRAQAKENDSSHALADFRSCPLLHRKKKLGLIPDDDRQAYLVGRAAHVRVLEGRLEYDRRFAIGGPINPKTGKPFGATTNAFAEWAAAQGKPVLTAERADLIENLACGVSMNDNAVDLISEGVAEGVIRTSYCGVPCQSRLDWVNPGRGIVDLKTADNIDYFEADARRYGYGHQLAFYQAIVAQVIGQLVPCYFIAIEKREPYRAGTWRLDDGLLATCRQENEAAMERLKECRRLDRWETGYEQERIFSL